MRCSWIVCFSLLLDVVFYADSAPPDIFEKPWMDHCDIKRLKLLPTQTTTPSIKTTRKPFPPQLPGIHQPSFGGKVHVVNNHPMVDVSAKLEKLIKGLKDKLILDALERGADPEVDAVNPNVRGFESNLYHDMYDDEGRGYGNVGGGSEEGGGGDEGEQGRESAQKAQYPYPGQPYPGPPNLGPPYPVQPYPGPPNPGPPYPVQPYPAPPNPGPPYPGPPSYKPAPPNPQPGPPPNFDHQHPGDILQHKKRRKMRGGST